MQRETISTSFPLGSKLPEFNLLNIDGKKLGSEYLKSAKAALVIFTCNHCPYVKGSDAMLIDIVRKFEPLGLRTFAVNSNDAAQYPEDSFEKMQEKARALKMPYPYLYDETQEVARCFDAACTPECYLFDAKQFLVFHGTINDNPRDAAAVKKDLLSPAIEAVLKGQKPSPEFVHPLGCSIKWK